jgi:hypothetical protein
MTPSCDTTKADHGDERDQSVHPPVESNQQHLAKIERTMPGSALDEAHKGLHVSRGSTPRSIKCEQAGH